MSPSTSRRGLLLRLCLSVSAFFLFLISNQVSAQYCDLRGDCYDWFSNIKGGTLNFSNNQTFCTDSNGYAYMFQDTLFLKPGAVTQFTVNPGSTLDAKVVAFLDLDDSKTFDETERTDFGTTAIAGTHVGALVLAPTAAIGNYRIRFYLGAQEDVLLEGCTGSLLADYAVIDFPVKITNDNPPTSPYCAATGDCANARPITNVNLVGDGGNDIDNTTPAVCAGYSDFTNLKAVLTTGTPYTLTVTGSGACPTCLGGAWIDYNEDGIFSDDESLGISNSPTMFVFAFTPAPTVTGGIKRLRVRNTLAANVPSPCGFQSNGEVEDYTVIINSLLAPLPDCVSRTGASPAHQTKNVCNSLDSIKWTAVAGASGYLFTLVDSALGNTIVNKDTARVASYSVRGLITPGRTYKWLATTYDDNGNAIGCDTVTFSTAANPDPVASIITSGPLTVCQGSAFNMNGNPSQGTIPFTHAWSGSIAASKLSDDSIQNPDLTTDSAPGDYIFYYKAKDANGCTAIDSITVKIAAKALAGTTAANPDVICEGGNTTVSVSGNTGTVSWQSSTSATGPFGTAAGSAVNATSWNTGALTTDTYYRATVTNGSCTAQGNIVLVTVTPAPLKPTLAADKLVACDGETIIVRTTNYNTDTEITWDDDRTTVDDTLEVTATGTFVATATVNGCTNVSDPISLTFNQNPGTPNITVSGRNPACDGETVVLRSSVVGGNQWSNGATTDTIAITADGSFTVSQTNSSGCSATSAITAVVFNPLPAQPVISIKGALGCEGSDTKLESSQSGTNVWSNGATGNVITVKKSDTLTVTFTDANGCKATSDPFYLIENPLPNKPVISAVGPLCKGLTNTLTSTETGTKLWSNNATGDDIIITAAGNYTVTVTDANGCKATSAVFKAVLDNVPAKPGLTQSGNVLTCTATASSYQWYDTIVGPIPGATAKMYSPTHGGKHWVTALSAQGCESDSSKNIIFSGVGIASIEAVNAAAIYPNPSNGVFTVDIYQEGIDSYSLTDLSGRVVRYGKLTSGRNELNPELSKGMYILQLNKSGVVLAQQRIVIE